MQSCKRVKDRGQKRGRPVNPESARQQKIAAYNSMRKKKHMAWENQDKNKEYFDINCNCCCNNQCFVDYDENADGYLTTLIRKYALSLSKENLRSFVIQRSRTAEVNSFQLEKPRVLQGLLEKRDNLGDLSPIPRPSLGDAADMLPVCQSFFLWLICKTEKYLNAHRNHKGEGRRPFVQVVLCVCV
jgi:hypothetical protein